MDQASNILADIVLKFSDISKGGSLANLGSSFASWETLVASFFVFAVFFYGLSIGKARLLLFLISIYIAKLFVDSFAYIDYLINIFGDNIFAIYLGLFIVSYIVVFMILDKSVLKVRLSTKEYPVTKILLLSVVVVVLLSNVVFTYLPPDIALGAKSGFARYIVGDTAFFWWFTISVFSILLLRRKKKN